MGDVTKAIQDYIGKMVGIAGMKALLLDAATTGIISMVSSQSEIISKHVFLVERIDAPKNTNSTQQFLDGDDDEEKEENMHHLKAIVFIRPSQNSIEMLCELLHQPKYKEYYIFFSNTVSEDNLRKLASADEHEVIRHVQEYYADYYAHGENVFSLDLPFSTGMQKPRNHWTSRERSIYEKNISGVLSCLLSLKMRPVVRYSRTSELAKEFSTEIIRRMKEEAELFHFRDPGASPPLLLVFDRREDPVTPLLQQWTYQAMVHELLGITSNRVDMSSVPGINNELKEVVLAEHQDHFYKGSMYLNFGDLGASIKDLVQNYQRKTKNNSKLDSIEDMQRFVENYPEFRALSSNVSKHVTVMTELSRLVKLRRLMEVSELEQEMVCNSGHAEQVEQLNELMRDPQVQFDAKLRVVLLYAIRYEKRSDNALASFRAQLREQATSEADREKMRAIGEILKIAGVDQRGGDLFQNKDFLAKTSKFLKSQLKGVENIYTQHRPFLSPVLDSLLKGKLKTTEFPFVGNANQRSKPSHVFIFIIGGCTYEEAATVAEINKSDPSVKIVLGGSYIHNTKSYLNDILDVGSDSIHLNM